MLISLSRTDTEDEIAIDANEPAIGEYRHEKESIDMKKVESA